MTEFNENQLAAAIARTREKLGFKNQPELEAEIQRQDKNSQYQLAKAELRKQLGLPEAENLEQAMAEARKRLGFV